MERTCVLVADRLRARVFDVEPIKNPHHKYQLEERVDLVNRYPQAAYQTKADSMGANLMPNLNERLYFSDHKQQDEDHDDKKFAKEVTQELLDHLKSRKPDQLILVAPPHFLGALREYKQTLRHEVDTIQDLAKELSHLSAPEIRDYLEQKFLL